MIQDKGRSYCRYGERGCFKGDDVGKGTERVDTS